jgi:sulfite reductase (NADPH) flavoprotein alpha-component
MSTQVLSALGVVLAYASLCGIVWRSHARRRNTGISASSTVAGTAPVLIAHATQTGTAEQHALQTARMLSTAGVPTRLVALSRLDVTELQHAERALFIVSTYGEGDAPDSAARFARELMGQRLALGHLHYGLLALGDREYANFCGFGRALDAWLQQHGAKPLFDRVEVDNHSEEALREWQHRLSRVAGTSDLPDWQAPGYEHWRLVERRLLNAGSAGAPSFHVELEPMNGTRLPHWESGDLVQVRVPADPQRPREYSIASIPSDGRVHLLVRQERRSDGMLGMASGWLTEHAAIGTPVELRLRAHRNFRLGDNMQRPLVLIGNGSGLGGLRGHIKARAEMRAGPNWLVFGERNAARDFYHREEIEAWQAQGVLERTELVFSRDGSEREYVQDRLRKSASLLREWVVQREAALYVCGSLEGMAAGVDAALREVLGSAQVDALVWSGRYRRDVY